MTKLNVTELEFEAIKQNIRTFISSKPEFNDYNFEGSALSNLLDILAYNTYYNAVYTTMTYNESFLDTAVKRANVVSNAFEIGYTPRSITAPRVDINFQLEASANGTSNIIFERGTTFSTNINGNIYNYTLLQNFVSTGPTHTPIAITAFEGRLFQENFTVVNTNNERFLLSNENVDTTHIKVKVNDIEWQSSSSIITANGESEIYFIREVNGFVEIIFGNDVLGKAVQSGDSINVEYLITSGDASNGSGNFSFDATTNTGNTGTILGNPISYGGLEKESIQNIKFMAPRAFVTQNRMVTKEDHITLLKQHYPNIETINVWGGEENIPVDFGSVYVSIKPFSGDILSDTEREDVLQLIDMFSLVTTRYILVDPDYTYIIPNVEIRYDITRTNLTQETLRGNVVASLFDYNDNILEKFDVYFKHSNIVSLIDEIDPSFVSNTMSITLEKRFDDFILNSNTITSLDFNNPIEEGSIKTDFYLNENLVTVQIKDKDGVLFTALSDDTVINSNIGTIDYATGRLNFSGFNIRQFVTDSTYISIKANPTQMDVETARNTILSISTDEANIRFINYDRQQR